MYKFSYFTEKEPGTVLEFMRKNPFALITGNGDGYPVATHLPFEIVEQQDGRIILSGHMMKNTDHHKAFEKNDHVLVIFNGPDTYVSASWYDDTASGSTWNYMTVHASGKIRFLGEEGAYKAVKSITDKYEGTESIASFNKLPEDYVSRMVKAIVGFEVDVTNLYNVFKLSQNHNEETRKRIVAHLKSRGDNQSISIAAEMEKRFTES